MSEPRASDMIPGIEATGAHRRGLLARLGHDTAGNVFAMAAAAVIPMIGVVGGAIDASRLYMTRTRLQAACDSGVLAGRKAMTTNSFPAGGTAEQRARAMFEFNYQDADFQTTGTAFTPSADANGKLSATANTTVPMTLMKIFGFTSNQVSVRCSADVQIPNIDIVFVLDVTGSMNSEIGGVRKIESMQTAAIRFHDTLQAQLTAAGANAGRVRYGFVPYSQAVNGRDLFRANPNNPTDRGELPLTALVNNMVAESRVAHFDPTGANEKYIEDADTAEIRYDQTYSASRADSTQPYVASSSNATRMSNFDCSNYAQNLSMEINDGTTRYVHLFPNTAWPGADGRGSKVLYIPEGSTTAQATKPTTGSHYWEITFSRRSATWEDNGGQDTSRYKNCQRRVTRTRFVRQDFRFSHWTYQPVTFDVSNFKAGTALSYASRVTSAFLAPGAGPFTPTQLAAAADTGGLTLATTTWDGCIEERDTTAVANFAPIPAAAKDLNVITGATDDTFRWRPILRDLTYDRGQPAAEDSTSNFSRPSYECPDVSMRNLNTMTRTEFVDYVNSLTPAGSTYLDVGMAWGLRLIAPQGMFGARNLTGPNGGQISRHIIFLTDGELAPLPDVYSSYGIEEMSRRVAGSGSYDYNQLRTQQNTLHARRFQALCDVQRGSISIWAIAFGTSVTSNLTTCADPNRAYQADNATELDAAFANIARDIADLRLVQ